MCAQSANTKIYIGGQIEPASELEFLAFVVPWLDEQGLPSIVLANVELGGRQIDCIIATENSVSVVEVKASHFPIHGDTNGSWRRLYASGEWRDYPNAYQQAVAAKNRVRDAMRSMKPVGDFYPNGYVVFTTPNPEASELTSGDFKARVTTIDQFPRLFDSAGGSPWALADWEALARQLKLSSVPLDEAIAGAQALEAFSLLRRYNEAVVSEYGRDAERWLPETESQRGELLNSAAADAGCFISGPSGCGKSLMAKWLAAKFASEGHPTLFLAAKNFDGSWAASLRREVGLLINDAPNQLYRAAACVGRSVVLVVDGINEFPAAPAEALRGVRALARRLGARLVVTAQDAKPAELGGLRSFPVLSPSLELKQRIARSVGMELTPAAQEVLRGVRSGIEARIVGQIGSDLNTSATRYFLVDQYIRKRLGGQARSGAFGLRRLASSLHEQIAFSMIEVRFDELMRAQGVSFAECDLFFASDLLVRRAGRVSFSHEMILNACAAFDLAERAASDPASFGQRLSTPILEPISGDIISVIDDAAICRAVLCEVMSSSLLVEGARGHLGAIAASITLDLLKETTESCIAEIRAARLVLSKEESHVRIGWEEETKRTWTFAEQARLQALGRLAVLGPGIKVFLGLCAEMDARLSEERQRWLDFSREERYPIRSQSFALAYYGFGESIGLTSVARSAQRGLEPLGEKYKVFPLELEDMTSGQLHFFLEGRRVFFEGHSAQLAESLIFLLRERFRQEPYHVQLVMLNSVGYLRQAPQDVVERLTKVISELEVSPANWGISSSVFEALKILGALDGDAENFRAQVKAELASVLLDDGDAVDNDLALSLCVRMFDNPFDSIYGEEICDLDEELRRRLYRRALHAPTIRSSTSLDWLVKEVAAFGDPLDASSLKPLTALPSRTNPFVQEEWGAFATATRFVGRHHAVLEPIESTTPEERCLVEIRSLVYALEGKREADAENARLAWRRLHEMRPQLVVGCLSEVQQALAERFDRVEAFSPVDLVATYPSDCLAVSRRFIDDGIDAQFYHQVPDREGAMSFAFNTVGIHGDRSDVERLRKRSRAHRFARHALEALAKVDL